MKILRIALMVIGVLAVLICVAAILAVPEYQRTISSASKNRPEEKQSADNSNTCSKLADLARTIMQGRQSGTSAKDMMKTTNGSELFEVMIIDAYDQPQYSTQKHIDREIDEFENKWFIECKKNVNFSR